MKPLQEADIIRIMREEYAAKLRALDEAVSVSLTSKVGKEGEEPILTPGLKVRHKRSQIRYTLVSVSPRDVILKTPEGEEFLVDAANLESEYELD